MNDGSFASDIKSVPLDAELAACENGVASCFCANLWKHKQNIVPPTDRYRPKTEIDACDGIFITAQIKKSFKNNTGTNFRQLPFEMFLSIFVVYF